jgi:Flp pilus assembly protein TadG
MTAILRRIASRLRADRRGLTSLEMGLVALPLSLLMFGMVEIGLVVRMKSALQYATAQVARCAAVDATLCGTTDTALDYAVTQTMGVAIARSAFAVTSEACGRKVTASVGFPVITHSIFPNALTVSASACYPI